MNEREYDFFDVTTSLCERCSSPHLVPAKIIFKNNCVYYVKECQEEGFYETLISTDIDYFLKAKTCNASKRIPYFLKTPQNACPFDCGLCTRHERNTCYALIEITDDCNLKCKTASPRHIPDLKCIGP